MDLAGRVRWRLTVPTIVFMLMSSLDRANLSFAAGAMNRDLGLSPSQYGFGAGIVFAGYLLGQYPSVLLLQRTGMRRWLCTCALLWGASAALMAWIQTPWQFYVLRVVLGAAEGGLAPGIVLYLSQFASERERATTFAMPMLAIPISIIVGGPLSGALLQWGAAHSTQSWRLMYLIEALPTIALGLAARWYFPDRPADARWLSDEEQRWLARHAANRLDRTQRNDWRVLRQPLVWMAALVWFCLLSGAYGIIFWLPQVIRTFTGFTPTQVGWLNSLPWIALAFGIYLNSAHSDRVRERFWHVAAPAIVAAASLWCALLLGGSWHGLPLLLLAGFSLGAAQGAFWALPTSLLTPATLAVAAAAINTIGSTGGLVMPQAMGLVFERTRQFQAPTLLICITLLLAAALVLVMKMRRWSAIPPWEP